MLILNHAFVWLTGKLEYQAQSPDEGALVSAARNFGFVFKVRCSCYSSIFPLIESVYVNH